MPPAARQRALRAAAAVAALTACTPKPTTPVPATVPPASASLSLDACLNVTEQAANDGDMSAVLDCCTWLDDHFSAQLTNEDWSALDAWTTRDECCAAHNWQGGLACTPWGPPTPPHADGSQPAMAAEADILDLREAVAALAVQGIAHPPEELREAAIGTWLGRMVNEHGSAGVFEALAVQLEAAGAPADAVAEIAGFAAEERLHGVLCGAVATALGGQAFAVRATAPVFPDHTDASRLEAALRNVLSVACLSETVAVSLIGAERQDMPEGPLRDVLTRIWSDEVGHARAGWRLLDALLEEGSRTDPGLADRLSNWLRTAFAHLETHELEHLPETATFGPEAAPWGLCSGREARTLFRQTVEQVIVVALEQRGLRAAEAWQRRGFVAHA